MAPISLSQLVSQLIEMNGRDAGRAAEQLGVSQASLSRWRLGTARPRKHLEERLRALVTGNGDLISPEEPRHSRLAQLESSISSTLHALREEFHRSASISTRQEVLDLVAGLVFAHVISIDHGDRGIGLHLKAAGESVVTTFNRFLAETFAEHLPQARWRRSFVPINANDERFAQELLRIFDRDAVAFRELHNAGRDDLINEVFSRFMSTSFVDEKEMGQYLTPPEIVHFMVQVGIHALGPDGRAALFGNGKGTGFLLDPSCGVGSFLAEAIRHFHEQARDNHSLHQTSKWISTFISQRVVGIDKSERMVRLAAANLALFGADARKLYVANALARRGNDGQITKSLEGQVQLILTNPPFGATFTGDDISDFRIGRDRRKTDSELLFLERYVDWLTPGGVVVTVIPDSILVNRGIYAELRKYLHETCELEGVFSLPSVTFAAAGTSTKTSILLARKRQERSARPLTYFATAQEVGFDVITRSGQRRRIRTARSDLPMILAEFCEMRPEQLGRRRELTLEAERWDAPYHVCIPEAAAGAAKNSNRMLVRVSEVATLIDERVDPKHFGKQEFRYVEISDVDIQTGLVGHKRLAGEDAPSRARKHIRAGDVLVSTVRPERGAVAMVPRGLDGSICSTGFAVLRCFAIHPLTLVWLLKTGFVRRQMVRNNIGIAYPAISEEICLELVLPASREDLASLSAAAMALADAQHQFEATRHELVATTDRLDASANGEIAHSQQAPNFIDGGEPSTVANRA